MKNRILLKIKEWISGTKIDSCDDDCCECIIVANIEQEDHSNELKVKAIAATAGTVVFVMGFVFSFSPLFIAAYLIIGFDVIKRAIGNMCKGQFFDENFLMLVATLGAIFLKEYSEAVFVMLFYKIGETMQEYIVGRSKNSIRSLMRLRPSVAHVVRDGAIYDVEPETVETGETVVVKKGETMPLDGALIDFGIFDTSAITGESMPREITIGGNVLSGFINLSDAVKFTVTSKYENSAIKRIIDMISESASKKAKTEKFITAFSKYYTPSVLSAALLICIVPPLFLGLHTFSTWISRGLIFLVVSCPCALVLSVPLAYFAAIGGASKKGILIKGGVYLEELTKTDTVVFDKTGTLTDAGFIVKDIVPYGEESKEELLKFAAICESMSNHPLKGAIMDEIKKYGMEMKNSSDGWTFKETEGMGVTAQRDDTFLMAGNSKLMEKNGVGIPQDLKSGTTIHIALNGRYLGTIYFEDHVKDTAAKGIAELRVAGVKNIVMLTGDTEYGSMNVPSRLNIDKSYHSLLPNEKVEILEKIMRESAGNVLFAGDGINDAPVIMRADVGIAMGSVGSDIAIESADIVIADDSLDKIPLAIRIAKKTHSIVIGNITFSLLVKFVILAMGAFGFANLWEAAFADVGVALIAVLNSSRAVNVK